MGTLKTYMMAASERSDERIKLITEIIQGVQVVKLQAWEKNLRRKGRGNSCRRAETTKIDCIFERCQYSIDRVRSNYQYYCDVWGLWTGIAHSTDGSEGVHSAFALQHSTNAVDGTSYVDWNDCRRLRGSETFGGFSVFT